VAPRSRALHRLVSAHSGPFARRRWAAAWGGEARVGFGAGAAQCGGTVGHGRQRRRAEGSVQDALARPVSEAVQHGLLWQHAGSGRSRRSCSNTTTEAVLSATPCRRTCALRGRACSAVYGAQRTPYLGAYDTQQATASATAASMLAGDRGCGRAAVRGSRRTACTTRRRSRTGTSCASRPPARTPRRAHRPFAIGRVRACVRVCIRAVGVEGGSRWAGTRGCGDTSARMCCRQPSAGSSPCVCRTPLSDRDRDPPSFPRTASQAALWPVRPHLRLPAPQARAQAALSSDGHKPLTTKRMGVQVHILPRTLRLQCGYGTARIFAGADRPGRPAGSRRAVFSAAPGSGDSACTASDVCCGGTPPEGRMPLDAPPTSARRVCAMACRKWR